MKISIINKKFKYWRFIFSSPSIFHVHFRKDPSSILLLTVAFNEVSFVEQQIQLLKKHLLDPFEHIIVDNSTDQSIRRLIQGICKTYGVGYAGVPFSNPYRENKSHAAAMHWAYFQLVRKSKSRMFGFLDHDIFPLEPYSIKGKMVNGMYGRVMHAYTNIAYQEKLTSEIPYWSLWAGFCFFEKSRLNGLFPWSLNFFSKHFIEGYFLDTGGGLWNSLYSQTPYPGTLASYEVRKFSKKEDGIQNHSFEIYDKVWIHFVSLSNWRSIKEFDRKKEILKEFLRASLS